MSRHYPPHSVALLHARASRIAETAADLQGQIAVLFGEDSLGELVRFSYIHPQQHAAVKNEIDRAQLHLKRLIELTENLARNTSGPPAEGYEGPWWG